MGSVIGGVSAVDDDVGLNSQIRYMIRPDPVGHHKWFRIDNVTGVLTLDRPLDREKQKFYQVFSPTDRIDLQHFPNRSKSLINQLNDSSVEEKYRTWNCYISRFEWKQGIREFRRGCRPIWI